MRGKQKRKEIKRIGLIDLSLKKKKGFRLFGWICVLNYANLGIFIKKLFAKRYVVDTQQIKKI